MFCSVFRFFGGNCYFCRMICLIAHYDSPIGGMTMVSDGTALTALCFKGSRSDSYSAKGVLETPTCPVFDVTRRWLDMYFNGQKPDFTPRLVPHGTPFQLRVWDIILTVPYGKTISYGDIARRISPTMSAQAVGGAVGRNPIAIIIPCHRVIGADGSLTGYGGGLKRKRWMLEMERK